jgi:molybdopterin/thiamine biosynthesis adenylyltransferase
MIESVSSRHESELGGVFLPFGDASKMELTIVIDPASAGLASVQHTAWMLINLLVRLQGIVQHIHIVCPSDVPLCGRIVPLAPRELDLRTALIQGARAIAVVPVDGNSQFERTIVVGDGNGWHGAADIYAWGNGWCGGICDSPIPSDSFGADSALPFGPYTAACIAAGEVFKAARMNSDSYRAPKSAYYSVWEHRAAKLPIADGPTAIALEIDAALVGVGAVGSAFLHAVWSLDGVQGRMQLVDNDIEGIDTTNLNRYCLFGWNSVGKMKATEAANTIADAGISWQPHDVSIDQLAQLPSRIVSAVDINSSRQAIQNRYPARILSGSTLDLRAEILRCGPPGVGACLRCFNPPEKIPADEDLRARLRAADENQLFELARSANISFEDAKEWVHTGRCGIAGERLLPYIRTTVNQPLFSVGFVSVMAGTMLAAEFVKDYMGIRVPLSESAQRATFQFHSPLASANRASAYGRDPSCPMCNPSGIACQTWQQRFSELDPKRK